MLNGVRAETRGMVQAAGDELDMARRRVNPVDTIVLPQNQSTSETVLSNDRNDRTLFLDLLDAARELIRARLELHDTHRSSNQALLHLIPVSGKIREP